MSKIWQFITSLKNATGNLIFIGIIVVIIVALVNQEGADVPDSAVMILDPEGFIVEQKRAVDPFEEFLAGDNQAAETLNRDIIEAIELAAEDERIKAIALDLSKLQGSSISQYEAIAKAFDKFQEAGKSIYAFGTQYSQSQYYLAAHADKIYVDSETHPWLGGVFLRGMASYPMYMKSALDKLHVNLHVFKAGLYKGAAEVFTRDDMSDYSREANLALISQIWDGYIETIASERDIEAAAVNTYIDTYADRLETMGPVELAIEAGLIDKAISRTDWRAEMQAISGTIGDTYRHVDYQTYLMAVRPPIPVENPAAKKIGVIVAKGTILDGDQPAGDIGGDSLAKLIRKARNDDSVKAIVLRVDSGGGSAAASELIRTELATTQAEGKPVIASMGGVAASGGYWISTSANKIFASESTVTGSIGVFAIYPTLENSLDALGLHADGVTTTKLATSFSSATAINPEFEKIVQHSVGRTYKTFLNIVSDGRGLTVDETDSIAQGRVWTGTDALENGLVDAIGDLNDAIESAAMLADVSDYEVVYIEKELSPREQFLRQLMQSTLAYLPTPQLGFAEFIPEELRTLKKMVEKPGVYLQCVSCNLSL